MKLHKTDQKGFTLIELMIVIAIIGILAAIAIPNFISYRDKAFCSAAETDANSIASALSDYFSVPSNTSFSTFAQARTVVFPGGASYICSGTNTGGITQTIAAITTYDITVTDVSARCPVSYQVSNPIAAPADPEGWSQALGGTFTKQM